MKRVLAIVTFALAAAVLHADDDLIDADRPGIADGSHSMKHGHFHIETGAEIEGGRISLPTLLRYGVTDAFELRMENNDGSAPFSLGFKDHFFESRTTSVGVIGRWFLSHNSFGDLRVASDISPNEQWDINPNVGVAIDTAHSKTATGALTIQYNVTQKANVFVDTGIQRSQVLVDAGAAWVLGTDTQLDASVTVTAHGAPSSTVWSAGISRRF